MVGRAEQQAQLGQVSQYYFGYLGDAVTIFEDAIERLKRCEGTPCSIPEAIDMAHRIKGNAAMYDYAELGLRAAKVEAVLRAATNKTDHTNSLISLITLIDDIRGICQNTNTSVPIGNRITLAVENEDVACVSQSTLPSLDRKSVLLGYNDPWLCELMASLLETQFDVISLNSGMAVRRALKAHMPDLVILEDTLEGIGALDVLKDIKSSRDFEELPVFIAFDPGANEAIAEAIALGIVGFSSDKHEILDITTFAKDLFDKRPQSILIVDDDPVVRDLLQHTLNSSGFDVDIACDGLEALAYLSENEPDLVLLDRFMPRLEGGTVLYEIQNKINLKSIPVLILTSMVNRGEAKGWFERGAADFIPKPFDPEEVLMRVKQHLEIRQKIG